MTGGERREEREFMCEEGIDIYGGSVRPPGSRIYRHAKQQQQYMLWKGIYGSNMQPC